MLELPPLPPSTILLVEVGSTAHGTGLPGGEDLDLLGVVVEPEAEVFGLAARDPKTVMQRTQPEGSPSGPGDVDRTLHPLRRFLRLAASGNPSVLMSLWAPVIQTTELGDELRALAPAFVGRHVIPRYRGYMAAQGERLLGLRGGKHTGTSRDGLIAEHGYDTKYAMHAARLGFQGIELVTTGAIKLPVEGEPAVWLLAVRRGEVPIDEWFDRCLALDGELARLAGDESIRPTADEDAVVAWSIDAHRRSWRA